jgi:hypothetical protein
MTTNYTWNVLEVKADQSTGVVNNVTWELTASNGVTESKISSIAFPKEEFVFSQSTTEEQLIDLVKTTIGSAEEAAYVNEVNKQIDNQPENVTLSWVTEQSPE